MMEGIRSRPLSQPWMNWGMTLNGKCLTAKTLESPKIGRGCSLSDILEKKCTRGVFPFGSSGAEVDIQNEQSTNTITARYGAAQSNGSYIIESEQKELKLAKMHDGEQKPEIIRSQAIAITKTTF